MDFQDYQICGESGNSYWWFAGKNNLVLESIAGISKQLPKNPLILDIGCGRGEFLEKLARIGKAVAIDDSDNLQGCVNPHNGHLIQCDGTDLCFKNETFDLILMLDILEHFEDDYSSLTQAYSKLKAGGYLLITVPAVPYLFGNHDRLLKHFRRYSKRTLSQLIRKTGFKVERLTHWNFFLYLPIFIVRMIKRQVNDQSSDVYPLPPWINQALTRLIFLETFFITRGIGFPFGINLLGILRK